MILEKEKDGERREINVDVRAKHQSAASCSLPNGELNLHPFLVYRLMLC